MVDVIPAVLSNILDVTLKIINEQTNNTCDVIDVYPIQATNGVLAVHRFGDHYNRIVRALNSLPLHQRTTYTREELGHFNKSNLRLPRKLRKPLIKKKIWFQPTGSTRVQKQRSCAKFALVNAQSVRNRAANKSKTANNGVKSPRRSSIVPIQKEVILPTVKFGLMNVQSLYNKYDFAADHIVENKLDIVSITETWLSPKDELNSPRMAAIEKHGYKFIHRPRCSGRGGGVAVVVNKTLNCCRCPDFDAKSFEKMITSDNLMKTSDNCNFSYFSGCDL